VIPKFKGKNGCSRSRLPRVGTEDRQIAAAAPDLEPGLPCSHRSAAARHARRACRRRSDRLAVSRDWCTPPLWGLGLSRTVSGSTAILNGGARNVTEAIL